MPWPGCRPLRALLDVTKGDRKRCFPKRGGEEEGPGSHVRSHDASKHVLTYRLGFFHAEELEDVACEPKQKQIEFISWRDREGRGKCMTGDLLNLTSRREEQRSCQSWEFGVWVLLYKEKEKLIRNAEQLREQPPWKFWSANLSNSS